MSSSLSKSELLKKYQFKRLCHNLGFNQKIITHLLDDIDNNYREWSEKKIDSKTGQIKKYKDGTEKTRDFKNPSETLKQVQKRIKNNILSSIKLPSVVHGSVKKRSNISNAKPHQGNKYIFTTDLQDFFPNISSQKVYATLLRLGFSSHEAHWLTKLTTWKHELPQGAPTSPHLSNLVFLETDMILIELCNKHKITYTRYIDDLTFSSQTNFRHLLNTVLEIIKSRGYILNYRKTHYSDNQTVTGIRVFLNKIDAPDSIIEKSKMEFDLSTEHKPYTSYLANIRKTNYKKGDPR